MDALAAYQKRLVSILRGDEDREKIIPDKLSLLQLVTLFLEYLQGRVKTEELTARRLTDYRRVLTELLQAFGSDARISTLTQADFQKLRLALAENCKLHRLSEKIKIINKLFSWGVDAEYLTVAPKTKKWLALPERLAVAREKDHKEHCFSAEEIQRILLAAQDTIYPRQWRALILTALNCAFGSRDLADLTFDDIDFEKGIISLQRGKTGAGRRCVIWKATSDALKDYLENERPKTDFFSNNIFLTSDGTLWNYDTERSRVDSLGLAFRRMMKTMKIAETSFYSLRRTFRTVADETGDVPAINLIMGHTDYSMGGVYRQYIKNERLEKIAAHVWEWLQNVDITDLTQKENAAWESVRQNRFAKMHAPKRRKPTEKPKN